MIKPTETLKQVLALKLVKGCTPKAFTDGLATHGSIEALFNSAGAVRSWDRVNDEIEKCARNGVDVITYLDGRYPSLLKEIYDPPICLYVKGRLPDPAEDMIAMVGSREASTHGLEMAGELAQSLAAAGAVVVSGLAHGVDTASHEGALRANGRTLAVLGCGLGHLYPSENRKLAADIVKKGGALISEFAFDTRPLPAYFPQRNRIVSGLSRAVVIVEARENSGALITAHSALEQGRDVYAVPGNAASKKTLGSNRLLRDGARLITSAADLLADLGLALPPGMPEGKAKAKLSFEEEKLLGVLRKADSLHVDEIVASSTLSPQQTMTLLTVMAVKGVVRELPGKYFAEAET